jgi:cytochrome P450
MLLGIPMSDQEAVRDYFRTSLDKGEITLSGDMFADYIDWRVEHPSDDIMSQLLHTEFEDETGMRRRLTRDELLAYVNIIASAGNETTQLLIGWTCKLLSEHPDQRQMIIDDRSLVTSAIDEVLRFEPNTLQNCRYVARDVELYGRVVPAGSVMMTLTPAGNRDERQFSDPSRFDVRRKSERILTFGFGAHYCLGQALARLEGRVALEEVLQRFPRWHVNLDDAKFIYFSEMRGFESLPIDIT